MHWLSHRTGLKPTPPASTELSPLAGSAAAQAVLTQHMTGLGSGLYSGTPFRQAPDGVDVQGPPPAEATPSETERHHRGIIDHSRHVSSLGRR